MLSQQFLLPLAHELVVDLLAGGGASWEAAVGCGHKWLGFEVEDKFCALIVQRHAARRSNLAELEAG